MRVLIAEDEIATAKALKLKNIGGSGIGLAIAKAVTDAHDGKITAECPDGKRMTIKVVFR